MANIYQNIDKNKQDTVIVMALFVVVVMAIGWFVGNYLEEGAGTAFMGIALIFSGISGFVTYYNSDKMVLAISSAREVKETDNIDLHHLVENVCIGAGLPKPKVYVIDDTAMNAFATGRDPQHSVICFTTGIIDGLEKRELEGVIAHELSHIGNYDIRLMSIVSILVGTITLLADWFTHGRLYRLRGKRDSEMNGLILLLGIALIIISPIIATLIKLAVSRNREYLADSTGVLITRYPQGLASALRKIQKDREPLEAANGATAHLYISNPLKNNAQSENGNGFFSHLFDTHPPIEERIRRLENM